MASATAAGRSSGLVLGRYRPLRPLGSGGSGSVWHARDEKSGLDVALKIVAREGKAAQRAEREATAAARLRHERCLRAYALAHDERHVYIAYEYVAGRTLREALRDGELDDDAVVEAAAQVLEGLAYAHSQGVVHRDVKPSNVLLADGPAVSARLLDFGLATMEQAETLTARGDIPGTLGYIAPERLAGEGATPACDVWSAGVMLWEALAGRHPFWTASLLDSARAIQEGAPPLAELRPDLPKPLLAAVDRALSLDPARRPAAAKLAAALRAAQRPEQTTRRVGRPLTLRPAAVRLPDAALAAAGTGLGAAALPFYPPGWAAAFAAFAGCAALVRPRLGLAVALAAPVLPLGNLSLGLALLYAGLASAWLVLFRREPRGGLLPVLGPALGPAGALGMLPLLAFRLRSPLRRAAAVLGAVLLAAGAAGLRGSGLPLTGETAPIGLGIAGSESPQAVASALWQALLDRPALGTCALALAVGAALLPAARARGPWALAGLGSALLAGLLLPAGGVDALPLVPAIWVTWALLALPGRRESGS